MSFARFHWLTGCLFAASSCAIGLTFGTVSDAAEPYRAAFPLRSSGEGSEKRSASSIALASHESNASPYYAPNYGSPGHTIDVEQPAVLETDSLLPAVYVEGQTPDSPTAPTYQPPVVRPPEDSWKPGWLKNGQITTSYAPASGTDEFGFVSVDARTTFKTPLPFLTISPRFGLMDNEGTALDTRLSFSSSEVTISPDLPDNFYEASIETRWFQPLSEKWMLDFAVSPGIFTDGENTSSDAVRVIGRALAFYKWNDAVRLAFGAVYLDRDDVPVLPAVGAVVFPSRETKIELMFPRPKLSHRIKQNAGVETWAYVAGEFGGGQWAVNHASLVTASGPVSEIPLPATSSWTVANVDDTIAYRDYRFLVGIERKAADGLGWMVEGGFLFGREFEIGSTEQTYELDSTAIVRFGGTF